MYKRFIDMSLVEIFENTMYSLKKVIRTRDTITYKEDGIFFIIFMICILFIIINIM